MIEKNDLLNRIRGVIIGVALGDSFGMSTELWTRSQIKKVYPNGINKLMPALDNGGPISRNLPAGSVTDDTINTIMIANSIIENKGSISTQEYINKLIKWINESENAHLVCGPSTLRAIKAIQSGTPIEKAGWGSTTNGAAMKIAPIGIISDYNDFETLINNVYQICLPTHNTSIAVSGACVIAACVSYVISGKNDINDIWELALDIASKSKNIGGEFPSADLAFRIQYMKNIVENCEIDEAINRIVTELGSGVETIESIPAALGVVSLAKGDPIVAAQISASLGADTDTIGAIATGICGGINPNISSEYVELIESVNNIDFDSISIGIYPYCFKNV